MQKALRDGLEKYQVSKLVTLKEGETMVKTSEELPCNFMFHVSCRSILLSFLYLYYQSLQLSILHSTCKDFYKCAGFSQVAKLMSQMCTCFYFHVFFSNCLIHYHFNKEEFAGK